MEPSIKTDNRVAIICWSFDSERFQFLPEALATDNRVFCVMVDSLSNTFSETRGRSRAIILLCAQNAKEQGTLEKLVEKMVKTKKPNYHHTYAILSPGRDSIVYYNEPSSENIGNALQVNSHASVTKFILSQVSSLNLASTRQKREFVDSKEVKHGGKNFQLPRIEKIPLPKSTDYQLSKDEKEYLAIATCQITKDGGEQDVAALMSSFIERTWEIQTAYIFKQDLGQFKLVRYTTDAKPKVLKDVPLVEKNLFPPLRKGVLEPVLQKEILPEVSVDTQVHYAWSENNEYCALLWLMPAKLKEPVAVDFIFTLVQVILKLQQWSQPQSGAA